MKEGVLVLLNIFLRLFDDSCILTDHRRLKIGSGWFLSEQYPERNQEAVREWLFSPISASGANYNPRNTANPVFRDVFLWL